MMKRIFRLVRLETNGKKIVSGDYVLHYAFSYTLGLLQISRNELLWYLFFNRSCNTAQRFTRSPSPSRANPNLIIDAKFVKTKAAV